MAHQRLLLHQVDLLSRSDRVLTAPEYAAITDTSLAGSHAKRARRSRSVCGFYKSDKNRCRVWSSELANGAPGCLLRRPAFAMYGQVVAYTDDRLSIQHNTGASAVDATMAEEVASVIVFLLYQLPISCRIKAHEGFRQASLTVSLVPTAHQRPAKSNLFRSAAQPQHSDVIPWLRPTIGQESAAEVRDLAFSFSNVLATYRLVCESDIDNGTSTRLRVRERLSLHDIELSGLLLRLTRQLYRTRTPPQDEEM
ncbi:12-oxophytodienoate reductase [Phytophthora palmivora]|uniref:12-oxophytodienoate reductase n=1 Tax=Phytophthora palmivora TaxID=4796 RepID=A0A2P4XU72_9STRA|nr:12-oxophytodienoate reductase [Phytophthora palmivora]